MRSVYRITLPGGPDTAAWAKAKADQANAQEREARLVEQRRLWLQLDCMRFRAPNHKVRLVGITEDA